MKPGTILNILAYVVIMALTWWNFGFVYFLGIIGMMLILFVFFMTVSVLVSKRDAYREKREFYDCIYVFCRLPSPIKGRNLDAVNIRYKEGKMTNIEVKISNAVPSISVYDTASSHIRNTIAWRYELTKEQIAFSFSKLNEGIIEVNMLTSDKPEDMEKFTEMLYLESLHHLVHKIRLPRHDKVPVVEIAGVEPAGNDYLFNLLTVTFDNPITDELVEEFKTNFSRIYPDHQVSYSLSQEGRRLEVKQVPAV